MSKWIVDIHGNIEGDYEIIKKYDEPTTAVWSNYDKNDITQRAWHDVQTCSICGMGGKHYDEFKYCPNCGRIMTNAKGWGNRWK